MLKDEQKILNKYAAKVESLKTTLKIDEKKKLNTIIFQKKH